MDKPISLRFRRGIKTRSGKPGVFFRKKLTDLLLSQVSEKPTVIREISDLKREKPGLLEKNLVYHIAKTGFSMKNQVLISVHLAFRSVRLAR